MPRPKPLKLPMDFDEALRRAMQVKPAKADKSKGSRAVKKKKP